MALKARNKINSEGTLFQCLLVYEPTKPGVPKSQSTVSIKVGATDDTVISAGRDMCTGGCIVDHRVHGRDDPSRNTNDRLLLHFEYVFHKLFEMN